LHIMKMYSLLKNKGIMVTLCSPKWIIDNEQHQINFRHWLVDKEYYMQMLPDNSFIERDRSVPTALLKIFKKTKILNKS